MFITPIMEYVDVMGQMIIIEIDDKLCKDEEAEGLFHGGTISLRSQYDTEKHFKTVLYHEMFHALCEELGCQLDIHMEETLAHRVSTMFSGIIPIYV